jgi:hypothetical protein
MILNYSKEVRVFTISSQSASFPITVCSPDRPAESPDETIDNAEAGRDFVLEARPGTIYGFAVTRDATLTVQKPDKKVIVLTAVGKNPWPVPPAVAPSAYQDDEKFSTRFASFNTVEAGGEPPPATIQYLVSTPDDPEVSGLSRDRKTSKS